jgi:hypothetical protein
LKFLTLNLAISCVEKPVNRDPRATSGDGVLSCRIQREDCAWSGFRPDLQGAETAAILQEAAILVGAPHLVARAELPATAHLDIREVSKAATGHIRRHDHAPAFAGVETPDHAAFQGWMLPCHRPIASPSAPIPSTSSAAFRALGEGHQAAVRMAWPGFVLRGEPGRHGELAEELAGWREDLWRRG